MIGTLLKKEMKFYFYSPLTYFVSAFFIGLLGLLFFNSVILSHNSNNYTFTQDVLISFFGNINFLFLFVVPLLSMGSFIDEKKNNTLGLLLRSPIHLSGIWLAKLGGIFSVLFFLLLLTLIFPGILSYSGGIHWPQVLTGYLGTLFNGLLFTQVGMVFSMVFSTNILCAFATFSFLFFLLILSFAPQIIENFALGQLINYFSIPYHFEPFTRGIVRSIDAIYFLTFSFFILYFLHLILKKQRGGDV
jgi:ABC-2 type transport system permease protein